MKNDHFRSQFRLPNDLYERLRESAEREGRSLNAEIVARLEASFGPSLQDELRRLFDEQMQRLGEMLRSGQ